MTKIKFITHDGRKIELGRNGDVLNGSYDILNWHMDNTGEITFVKVGEYKFTSSKYEFVLPKNSTLFWNTESSRVGWPDILLFIHTERKKNIYIYYRH